MNLTSLLKYNIDKLNNETNQVMEKEIVDSPNIPKKDSEKTFKLYLMVLEQLNDFKALLHK